MESCLPDRFKTKSQCTRMHSNFSYPSMDPFVPFSFFLAVLFFLPSIHLPLRNTSCDKSGNGERVQQGISHTQFLISPPDPLPVLPSFFVLLISQRLKRTSGKWDGIRSQNKHLRRSNFPFLDSPIYPTVYLKVLIVHLLFGYALLSVNELRHRGPGIAHSVLSGNILLRYLVWVLYLIYWLSIEIDNWRMFECLHVSVKKYVWPLIFLLLASIS